MSAGTGATVQATHVPGPGPLPAGGGTGRLGATVGRRTQRLLYGEASQELLATELAPLTRIDQAHIVMLHEQGLLDRAPAARLLAAIQDIRAGGYAELAGTPLPRGTYLAYEAHLAARAGDDAAGMLHTGRSRNDMKATATLLRLRDWLASFVTDAARLIAVLLERGRRHRGVVMPVHTHFQAAMPITYGYYLVGVAAALTREVEGLLDAARGLRRCPMGAGAVAGTDLPLDPGRVAALLGFEGPPLHAVDAVASRDHVLKVLAGATGVTLVLSRLSADLQLWSTEEFGFVEFPDRLVGSSSAMPQKRNAFLLEHVTAAPAATAAAWAGAVTAMKGTPFSNSIAVGTEAVALAWPGLDAAGSAVLLAQPLATGARPRPERMLQRAEEGFTTATAAANHLVRQGVPFRAAHRAIGAAVREAVSSGRRRLEPGSLATVGVELPGGVLDPSAAAARTATGGGPGAWRHAFDDVHARLDALCRAARAEGTRLAGAQAGLDAAVARLCGDGVRDAVAPAGRRDR